MRAGEGRAAADGIVVGAAARKGENIRIGFLPKFA
jgi:hypothetical protein